MATSPATKRTPKAKADRVVPVKPEEIVRFWHPTRGGWHMGHLFAKQGELRHIRPHTKTRKVIVPAADVEPIETEPTPCPK